MAYDFSNIRSIIKSDGTELQKITDANGNIIWQKLYVWEKFNCNKEAYGYQQARGSTTLTYPTSGHIYKTLNFNKSTGKYTLSDPSDTIVNMEYWEAVGQSYDVDSFYPYSEGWKYFTYEGKYYELREALTHPYSGSAKVYRYSIVTNYKYSQGSTSYGYVTSTSSSTYPTNGRYSSDGYWYVKIA